MIKPVSLSRTILMRLQKNDASPALSPEKKNHAAPALIPGLRFK
jgi:hypothetical protein